ncbi:MAG: zinc ribbon domain-containing protein [Ignavibacteriales bacterium]|nr:zinc ribbon domain-containing protein [Ignavibacteriales bacterium]
MPTYQYKCSHCSHEFEESQSIKDSPLVSCPNCKQDRLFRVIGGGGLIFKGSGFYQTDYKSGSSPKKETTPEKKAETKPAESPAKPAAETKPEK